MPELLQKQLLDVEVAFRGFGFQESDDAAVPVPFGDGYEWGVFLARHERRFDLFSAGHTHTAAVTVRIWDAEPVPELVEWDEIGEVDFETTTGDVAVWTMTLGRSDHLIQLGVPGWWRVRVGCTGRAEVARVTQTEGVAYGVEKYVIDFWPKA
ncbi:hypothetical protein [Streptomyces sp. CB02261]|uniref:hypothetical protein n=1 Tax=Streptomyces sp. CB02261 TaxID=1703940 RepID=UPI00093A12C3|nr:hypothetical protein [Streptomyces sp. CB02261]OKJ52615.1 hypothetical protein AMK29_30825 [Streptomyces sp. CB02261]